MGEAANPNGLCWEDPDPGGERDYSMSDLDQVVYDPLEVVQYTKRDLGKAIALLRNSLVIDNEELRDLAEKIDRMWPNRGR